MMTESDFPYPYFEPKRLSGTDPILRSDGQVFATLGDYWSWAASDVVSNTNRGVFAEYLVAHALGAAGGVRDPWSPYDVKTPDGITVEVKSASYLQRWAQKVLTPISFSIKPSTEWDPRTNAFVGERRRQAQVYVFCILAHKDQGTIDPLDTSQWQFMVLNTATLDDAVQGQASISGKRLLDLGASTPDYSDLATAVRSCARPARGPSD